MKASTRTVYLPRRICHTTSEKEITLENPLPDLSPDISRLIRAEATAYPEQTEAGKDGVTVSGRVVFGLLYETDYKNKLAHASMTTGLPAARWTPMSASSACMSIAACFLRGRFFCAACLLFRWQPPSCAARRCSRRKPRRAIPFSRPR